jgi:hypothetical protein
VDVDWFLHGLKPEFESIRAQILGGSNLPSLLEVFSRIQQATIFDHGSQVSYERISECTDFVTTCGSFDSYRGRHGNCSGRGFVVAMILEVVVGLVVVNLANVLIVVIVIILWIFVGIYIANRLGLPIRLFL